MTSKNAHPKSAQETPKSISAPGTLVYVVRLTLAPTTMGLGSVPLAVTGPTHHVQALIKQEAWKDPMAVGQLLSDMAGEMHSQMARAPQSLINVGQRVSSPEGTRTPEDSLDEAVPHQNDATGGDNGGEGSDRTE